MFERDLPGENTMGFNQTSAISALPLEMCETMNGSWGYNIKDRRFKSSKTLIHTMVRAAGFGANFLLNNGPMPNGKLQPENIDTLKVIGSWLQQYGATIYGTRKGPIPPKRWGATTYDEKSKKVFVHILDLEDETLLIPDYHAKPRSVTFFADGSELEFDQTDYGLLLRIPKGKKQDVDTVVEIQL